MGYMTYEIECDVYGSIGACLRYYRKETIYVSAYAKLIKLPNSKKVVENLV